MRKVINKMVDRGGPDPHRRGGVLPRLAPGEALLHGAASRPRPTRTCSRSPTSPRRSSPRAARSPATTTSAAPCRSAGSCPSRTRRSSGPPSSTTRPPTSRLKKLRDIVREDKRYGRAIGFRYHDGKPGIVEGLLSRGDRRVGRVIEEVWRDGGRFDGWSEHFSYDRWMAAAERGLAGTGVDVDWYTVRERDYDEVLPWDHLDSGLDKDWLWADWEDALAAADGADIEVEDCRWTPCYDCGVCPEMDTEIQIGPTGQHAAAALRRLTPPPAAGAPTTCRNQGRAVGGSACFSKANASSIRSNSAAHASLTGRRRRVYAAPSPRECCAAACLPGAGAPGLSRGGRRAAGRTSGWCRSIAAVKAGPKACPSSYQASVASTPERAHGGVRRARPARGTGVVEAAVDEQDRLGDPVEVGAGGGGAPEGRPSLGEAVGPHDRVPARRRRRGG